jgi:hypothetical protein
MSSDTDMSADFTLDAAPPTIGSIATDKARKATRIARRNVMRFRDSGSPKLTAFGRNARSAEDAKCRVGRAGRETESAECKQDCIHREAPPQREAAYTLRQKV